jgi:hypothetical protein
MSTQRQPGGQAQAVAAPPHDLARCFPGESRQDTLRGSAASPGASTPCQGTAASRIERP